MAKKQEDRVKYYSPDGDKTKYLENQDLPARLKAAHNKNANFTMPTAKQTGSGDRKAQVAKRQAKTKTYLERKKSTPAKRSTVAGNTAPVRRATNSTPTSDYLRSTPPAQTFAQNGQQGQMGQRGAPAQPQYNPLPTYNMQRGAPPQPQYNPLPNYNTQSRPSVFSDPGVQTAIQGMQPQQPTGQAYINQFLQQQQPQIMQQQFNPWRRRW